MLYQVAGSTGQYTVHPDVRGGYCPCPAFSQLVLFSQSHFTVSRKTSSSTKHVLTCRKVQAPPRRHARGPARRVHREEHGLDLASGPVRQVLSRARAMNRLSILAIAPIRKACEMPPTDVGVPEPLSSHFNHSVRLFLTKGGPQASAVLTAC